MNGGRGIWADSSTRAAGGGVGGWSIDTYQPTFDCERELREGFRRGDHGVAAAALHALDVEIHL